MDLYEIKAKKVYAEQEKYCYVAEAVIDDNGEDVFVAIQKYDGIDITVSKDSMYKFIAGEGGDCAEEFIEEYTSVEEAVKSKYSDVIVVLKKAIEMLG